MDVRIIASVGFLHRRNRFGLSRRLVVALTLAIPLWLRQSVFRHFPLSFSSNAEGSKFVLAILIGILAVVGGVRMGTHEMKITRKPLKGSRQQTKTSNETRYEYEYQKPNHWS